MAAAFLTYLLVFYLSCRFASSPNVGRFKAGRVSVMACSGCERSMLSAGGLQGRA